MPRKSSIKPGVKRPSDEEKYREVREYLGENSDSNESFQTPPTDENVTDYRLNYSSQSTRNMSKSARTPKNTNASQVETRATRSSGLRNREEEAGPSTSRAPRSSTRQSAGSARRKATVPKRRNNVFKEMKRLQASTKLLIPRLPFARLIREILHMFSFEDMRITPTALEALQEAAEIYLTALLSDSYKCTLHRDRVTLQVKDIELARYLRGRSDPGNFG